MKTIWKLIAITVVFTLIAAACAPAPAPAPVQVEVTRVITEKEVVKETVVVKQEVKVEVPAPIAPVGPELPHFPVVTAVYTDTMPVVDASASDPHWKSAPVSQIGGMQWSAVYNDTDITFLLKWIDRDLKIDAQGSYVWDRKTNTWSQNVDYEHEWMNLAFDISSVVKEEGCAAFCHEYPPGSGVMHHQTATSGEYVDSWMLMGKHGFGQEGKFGLQAPTKYLEDKGWLIGNFLAKQEGPVVFDTTNTKVPRVVLAGNFTFMDYAEDNVMASADDTLLAARDRPRDAYCVDCHNQISLPYDPLKQNYTYPDDGEIKYVGNWEVPYTAPSYIETDPVDFIDAMIITQAEVDNGEAVAIAGLSPQEISKYWAKYEELNAVIPQLILKEASGSMADVLVASNWTNGVWTMEITRKLETPYTEDDVQFTDFTKEYPFSLTISNSGLLLGPQLGKYGGLLVFKPK